MNFAKKMVAASALLKPALKEAIDKSRIKVMPFSRACGVTRGKIQTYVYGAKAKDDSSRIVEHDLSLGDFAKVYDASIVAFARLAAAEITGAIAKFVEFAAAQQLAESDLRFSAFGQMLRNAERTGNPSELRDLDGVFYVFRRNGGSLKPITVSAIEIKYNKINNICEWENWQETEVRMAEKVHGLATQSQGHFHFFGFASNSTTIHAMSVFRMSAASVKYLGVVLTTDLLTPLVSRVVMVKAKKTYTDAFQDAAWMTEDEAALLGLPKGLLDNSCTADGAIRDLNSPPVAAE